MMKKARMMAMDSSPSSSSLPIGDDARARYKHQALLQDYHELLRETEAKKRKLQKTNDKKLKLKAEVKFLKRKYKSFVSNPSQEIPYRLKKLPLPHKMSSTSVGFVQPHNPTTMNNPKEAETPSASALFDLNKNAEEMEGIQAEWELPKGEKSKRCSVDGGVVARGLNLPIFKDVGNGSSHVGKRKISWQDQVALRV